ncbi:NAD-dependent epimerase/dehydratase family protein [Candidatus Woesearchaeota archaeon]|nr:NAD-dependent epimerase/dehydratase family protein [Candidatus Woesearchaeota archaeon]
MIALTGATGFIGKNLINKLKGKKIKCLIRRYNENLGKKNIIPVMGDITNKTSAEMFLKGAKILIHLAAVIDSNNRKDYYSVNVEGTKNLVDACKKNKVKRIIFVSSMASTKDYLDDYGRSKKIAEDIVKRSGLNYTILRPSLVYGENSNSMRKMVSLIDSFKFIPIVGNGEYKINPVHVNDVVSAILSSIESKKSIGKAYDILGKSEITFNEFVDMVSAKYNIHKRKVHIPIQLCLAVSSIGSILGPHFPLKKSFVLSLNSRYKGEISQARSDLNYHPIEFKEGLNR